LVTTVVAAVVGPRFIDLAFGAQAALTSRDLALLAIAFVVVMAAICLDQALVALSSHSRMALGWFVALGVFVTVTALGDDLYLRVELGLLAGSLAAMLWMGAHVAVLLRHHARGRALDLSEAMAELPVQQ
jgi:hypothetical protein